MWKTPLLIGIATFFVSCVSYPQETSTANDLYARSVACFERAEYDCSVVIHNELIDRGDLPDNVSRSLLLAQQGINLHYWGRDDRYDLSTREKLEAFREARKLLLQANFFESFAYLFVNYTLLETLEACALEKALIFDDQFNVLNREVPMLDRDRYPDNAMEVFIDVFRKQFIEYTECGVGEP